METTTAALRRNYWEARGRWLVFVLAASSIACLLADFYGLCPMRIFTPFIFLPALLALFAFAGLDRWKGEGHLWRAVSIGLLAGLLAAVAYDVFRLPFVFAKEWRIESVVPPIKLFKVFPRFGAIVLGQNHRATRVFSRRAHRRMDLPLQQRCYVWLDVSGHHRQRFATTLGLGGIVRAGTRTWYAFHAISKSV